MSNSDNDHTLAYNRNRRILNASSDLQKLPQSNSRGKFRINLTNIAVKNKHTLNEKLFGAGACNGLAQVAPFGQIHLRPLLHLYV